MTFQSTHPLRGATLTGRKNGWYNGFQSTHPLRGATGDVAVHHLHGGISIHAPLAGCDPGGKVMRCRSCHFNPRTPCGVRLRQRAELPHGLVDFNPRTPCGVRQRVRITQQSPDIFQSTHPLRGATAVSLAGIVSAAKFQSTHPLRGATIRDSTYTLGITISIHAPLAGCDATLQNCIHDPSISIHAPLAGCDRRYLLQKAMSVFISIHAPLAGCDGGDQRKGARPV